MSNEIFVKRKPKKIVFRVTEYNAMGFSKKTFAVEKQTIEQYLSEHPEIVEKIFEAARDKMFAEEGYVQHYRYPTGKDYIDSLKQKPCGSTDGKITNVSSAE